MAETGSAAATDFPLKRPRDDGEKEANNNNNGSVLMEMDSNKQPDCISSVIPGWFSEISPMWPGLFFFSFSLYRLYVHAF